MLYPTHTYILLHAVNSKVDITRLSVCVYKNFHNMIQNPYLIHTLALLQLQEFPWQITDQRCTTVEACR